jgi:peptidoglycan/LPS O-acetylase OafA/YrhL
LSQAIDYTGQVKHLKYLDSLRGIAILLVILVHSWIMSGHVIPFFFIGQRGVQLFFIVSALTLMMSLHTRRDNRKWASYFVRRFFRIAPMFYLAMLGNIILTNSQGSSFSPGEILLGAFMMHGFSPQLINVIVIGGWSVAVEVMFYLALPLIFWLVRSLFSSVVLLGVTFSVCGWGSWKLAEIYPAFNEYFTFLWFGVELPVFCIGVFLYFAKDRIDRADLKTSIKKPLSLALTVAGVTGFVVVPHGNSTLYVSSAFLGIFVLGVSLVNWPLFVNDFLAFTGKISYSMYLIHFFVIIYALDALRLSLLPADPYKTLLVDFTVVTSITMAISYFTWKYIETPFIKIGGLIAKRLSRVPWR